MKEKEMEEMRLKKEIKEKDMKKEEEENEMKKEEMMMKLLLLLLFPGGLEASMLLLPLTRTTGRLCSQSQARTTGRVVSGRASCVKLQNPNMLTGDQLW